MSDAHSAPQSRDRIRIEHIFDHAIALTLVEATLRPTADDSARILTSVLQEGQALANLERDIEITVVV